ncbi:hypothetical protein V7793_18235 [Streptomyces sp. KLMMK]|uniref:hypothetical protein n=1 Tax=Streptomyces sp. KLMMK TaxID=3109353 RepID=UPI00300BE55F
MDTSMLRHPLIARAVETLVADGGGVVTYYPGWGGREILAAAGARLAARTRTPLTIVDHGDLHADISAAVAELQPAVDCRVTNAWDAASQPPEPGGVLAVHTDQLIRRAARQSMRDLAQAASHVVVVGDRYFYTTLDDLAGPEHQLIDPYLHVLAMPTEYLHLAEWEAAPHLGADTPGPQPAERTEAMNRSAEQRAAALRDWLVKGAQDRAAAPRQPRAPHQQDQAQSATHQQYNSPGGRMPGP